MPALTWAPERYAHLGNALASRYGAAVVLLGEPEDTEDVQRVRLDLGAPVADASDLGDVMISAALMSRCHLLVGTESALLPLAAAVGIPSIGLYARGRARRAPAGADHTAIESSGDLDAIRVEDVVAAVGTQRM
jgi:ADP-heptose:LPS heptosyltransferase